MTWWKIAIAGIFAGGVNGLFGAGGGMVLVPALTLLAGLKDEEVFPASVCIILPICIISLLGSYQPIDPPLLIPLLLGSAFGGILSGFLGKNIPVLWLHRGLGLLILWGGVRYLC